MRDAAPDADAPPPADAAETGPAPDAAPGPRPRLATTGLMRATLVTTLVLGLGVAAATTLPIDGAVIAEGRVLVEGRPQAVQSLDPGIVTRVAVRNGDQVEAGQVLLELDSATARTRLEIAQDRLAEALAEQARLEAEANGRADIDFTLPALPITAPDMGRASQRQQALFAARQNQLHDAQARLKETEAQLDAQIAGTREQLHATREEARLIEADVLRQSDLVARGLARQAPLGELQRQYATVTGRRAQLESELSRLAGARRDARLAHAESMARRAEEIAVGLRDRSAEIQQILSEIGALREELARTELRAPVAGVVHDLTVPVAGSVISAGTALAQILPSGRALEIEAEVNPRDIDKLHEGQRADILLSAFDMRNMSRIGAQVTHVPPDAVRDPQTGRSFYRVTLALDEADLPEGLSLRAGMDAQVFLTTGSRTLLSWLVTPITTPMSRALRES